MDHVYVEWRAIEGGQQVDGESLLFMFASHFGLPSKAGRPLASCKDPCSNHADFHNLSVLAQ